MRISGLISNLQHHLKVRGDITCYCNGEHGASEIKMMDASMIFSGEALLALDEDTVHRMENQSEIVLLIGDD